MKFTSYPCQYICYPKILKWQSYIVVDLLTVIPILFLHSSFYASKHIYFRLVSSYQLNAHVLYSITICMLRYNPQHVSSSTLLIFRRKNCIITASGILTLCKRPYSILTQSALNRHTVQPFTESDNTRCCNNTICPPEDKQGTARNMSRIIM